MARVVQLSEVLEKQRINNAVTHVWQYVPSGIVTQDVLDNVENAKQPLVKIYHYHNNHLGTPQELSDDKGDIVWLSYDRAWGGSFETIYKQQFIDDWSISEAELQPIKFQGQSLDVETGLHYNRFRYYDSDVGMFIQRDPIGLLGGNNVFQYAPNPIGWIDPWGLNPCHEVKNNKTHQDFDSRREALRQAKRDAGIPNSQVPVVRKVDLEDGYNNKVLDKNFQPVQSREYIYTNNRREKIVIQEHHLGHTKATTKKGKEPHFNVRPESNTNTGSVKGTHGHYNFKK